MNKILVVDMNLHETKTEILGDYTGDFEKIGILKKLVVKFVKHVLDIQVIMILNLSLTQLMEDLIPKTVFLMSMFIKQTNLNYLWFLEVNLETDVISNIKLLNYGDVIFLYPIILIVL